jgi:hypothetical protein
MQSAPVQVEEKETTIACLFPLPQFQSWEIRRSWWRKWPQMAILLALILSSSHYHPVQRMWRESPRGVCKYTVSVLYLSHYDPMTHSHFDTWRHSQQNIQSPLSLKDFWFATLFHKQNTSRSHDNLRRVSKSPLLHPFIHCRSGTLDWCVTRATSADSSRLIPSTSMYFSSFFYTTLSINLLSP